MVHRPASTVVRCRAVETVRHRYEGKVEMKPLHPQAEAFVREMAANPRPGWHEMPLEEARAGFEQFVEFCGPAPELAHVEDVRMASGARVRVYRDSEEPASTPVVFFHGGGWVLGSIDSHDALCRRIAAESGATVFSVDYRLAPEFPYPAALDDCYAVTCAVAAAAGRYAIDPAKLIVTGDSAGGNLAAAVAVRARDESGPAIAKQILIYPVVSPLYTTPSYSEFADGYGLTREMMMFFWQSYIGNPSQPAPPTADLAQIADFANLPEAHVILASHDVLYGEGLDLARQFTQAGVPTTVTVYDGMLHGFVHFAGLFDDGLEATSQVAAIIRPGK